MNLTRSQLACLLSLDSGNADVPASQGSDVIRRRPRSSAILTLSRTREVGSGEAPGHTASFFSNKALPASRRSAPLPSSSPCRCWAVRS